MIRILILLGTVSALAAYDPNAANNASSEDQPRARQDRGSSSYQTPQRVL